MNATANPIETLLNFINAFQLETQTAPSQADIAARFTEWRDLSWWLNHLVDMGYLLSSRLVYVISAEGLTALERATGVQKLVSGSMVIGYDVADGDASWKVFKGVIAGLRNGRNVNASIIANDPRLMGVSRARHEAVYFSEWFPRETALRFWEE